MTGLVKCTLRTMLVIKIIIEILKGILVIEENEGYFTGYLQFRITTRVRKWVYGA